MRHPSTMGIILRWGLWTRSVVERLERRPGSAPQPKRRGTALIVVLATVALLSVSVVEYLQTTRVNLFLAENHRDEVQAYFLARSGINLQVLSLVYQSELVRTEGFIGEAVRRSNFQLWEYLDLLLPTFSNATLSSPIGSVDLEETGATGFGGLSGDIMFHSPEPEEGKINLNAFAGRNVDQATLQALCSLVAPAVYDGVFQSTVDREREVRSRFDVVAAIIDHIDSDTNQTQLDAQCQLTTGGVGNEANRYLDVPWGPKDEPLVSLDELRMVPGVTEEFLDQFRDSLTIYPIPMEFYPNLARAPDFLGFLCAHVEGFGERQMPCAMPQVAARIALLALALEGYTNFFRDKLNLIMAYAGLGAAGGGQDRVLDAARRGQMIAFQRPEDFIRVLNTFQTQPDAMMEFVAFSDYGRRLIFGFGDFGSGSFVPPAMQVQFAEATMRRKISVQAPQVFTIRATGRYGVAERTIRAVVDVRGEASLLYWRED